MFTIALLAGLLTQLTFVPPEASKPQPSPPDTVCRRLTLPHWDKPRVVCLTRAEWRALSGRLALERQKRTGKP